MQGRQVDKGDLLAIAGDLGISFGPGATTADLRSAIRATLRTIHSDLAALFPGRAGLAPIDCQRRLKALHHAAEAERARLREKNGPGLREEVPESDGRR